MVRGTSRKFARRGRFVAVVVGLTAVLLTALLVPDAGSAAAAQTERGAAQTEEDDSAVAELAQRYTPVYMLKEQDEECDEEGEPWAPMAVDLLFDNPQVALRAVGNDDPVVMWGPSARDVARLGKGFYLDFPGSSLSPGCIFERDFREFELDRQPTVYAHVVVQPDRPDELVLQYWTYWYFNRWNNTHEGDWEAIQIVFPAGSVEEALQVEPSSVGYSQHEGGERADWDSDKLERDGSRPIVYSSAGSHASYFGSALYLGRSGSEGFGCDNTDGPSVRLDPEVVVLPDEPVTDVDDPMVWTSFAGRWGERHSGPWNGPDGPYQKGRWTEPLEWNDDLRSSSVVVPQGDSQAAGLFNLFCDVVAFVSNQLLDLKASPERAIFTLAIVGGLAAFIVTRTSWKRVDPLPICRRRRAGQLLRTTLPGFRLAPLAFLFLGVAAIPIAFVASLITSLLRWAPLTNRALIVSGSDGVWRLFLSAIVGGLATLVTTVVAIAAVAWTLNELDEGHRPRPREIVHVVADHARPLAAGFGRAAAVVIVLALTVVGIPFAIWKLVRYQFLPQVVMIEGLDGRKALQRSSSLIKGRWWHTAFFVAVVDAAILLVASTLGLLALVLFRPPVWLLSLGITLASLIAIPLAAIALTLLYGDAVAQRDDDQNDQKTGTSSTDTSMKSTSIGSPSRQ